MDGFNQRQKAFETKFSHDEEMAFRINARCNRLFGLWAAGVMDRINDDAESYAQEVIMANFEKPGVASIIQKVFNDLQNYGIEISEHKVSKEYDKCNQVARKMILNDEKL